MQAALAMILAIGGGLLLASYANLTRQEVGFDRKTLAVTVAVPLDVRGVALHEALDTFLGRLRAVPGVVAVGMANAPVVDAGLTKRGIIVDGVVSSPDAKAISPGFLNAAGMSLVEGRGLTSDDADWHGVLVNQTERLGPG
jgi:hypothetical protein